MSDDTRRIVTDLYRYYAQGDGEKFAALLHEQIDWVIYAPIEVFPFAGQRHGREAVLAALAELAKQYALDRYQPERVIVDGDRAAVLSDVTFTQRATGRTLRFHIADFLRVQDGKVVEFREFTNTFDVVEQALGRWLQI